MKGMKYAQSFVFCYCLWKYLLCTRLGNFIFMLQSYETVEDGSVLSRISSTLLIWMVQRWAWTATGQPASCMPNLKKGTALFTSLETEAPKIRDTTFSVAYKVTRIGNVFSVCRVWRHLTLCQRTNENVWKDLPTGQPACWSENIILCCWVSIFWGTCCCITNSRRKHFDQLRIIIDWFSSLLNDGHSAK